MHHHGLHVGPFIVVGLVVTATTVVVVIWLLLRRYLVESDGLSKAEAEKLSPEQSDILAMLRQKGGPLSQSRICEDTGKPSEEIASHLRVLENKGLVQRKWDSEKRAYIVWAK